MQFGIAGAGFSGAVIARELAEAGHDVYFVDARGLVDMPGFFSAQFGAIIDERDMLSAIADTTRTRTRSAAPIPRAVCDSPTASAPVEVARIPQTSAVGATARATVPLS